MDNQQVTGASALPTDLAPLQPVSGFLDAMAARFQEVHVGSLGRDRALLLAVEALADVERDCGPFHHPDFDWSLNAATEIANAQIEYWEGADGEAS